MPVHHARRHVCERVPGYTSTERKLASKKPPKPAEEPAEEPARGQPSSTLSPCRRPSTSGRPPALTAGSARRHGPSTASPPHAPLPRTSGAPRQHVCRRLGLSFSAMPAPHAMQPSAAGWCWCRSSCQLRRSRCSSKPRRWAGRSRPVPTASSLGWSAATGTGTSTASRSSGTVRRTARHLPCTRCTCNCPHRFAGAASHRSWRIEKSIEQLSNALNPKLVDAVLGVDAAQWGSLAAADPIQHVLECEYIEYDGAADGPPPKIEPHVDNGAKVTIIVLLSDQRSFDGGMNFFGGGPDGQPRTHQLKTGEAIFFRGEEVEHWITPVTRGARSILQVRGERHCFGARKARLSSRRCCA